MSKKQKRIKKNNEKNKKDTSDDDIIVLSSGSDTSFNKDELEIICLSPSPPQSLRSSSKAVKTIKNFDIFESPINSLAKFGDKLSVIVKSDKVEVEKVKNITQVNEVAFNSSDIDSVYKTEQESIPVACGIDIIAPNYDEKKNIDVVQDDDPETEKIIETTINTNSSMDLNSSITIIRKMGIIQLNESETKIINEVVYDDVEHDQMIEKLPSPTTPTVKITNKNNEMNRVESNGFEELTFEEVEDDDAKHDHMIIRPVELNVERDTNLSIKILSKMKIESNKAENMTLDEFKDDFKHETMLVTPAASTVSLIVNSNIEIASMIIESNKSEIQAEDKLEDSDLGNMEFVETAIVPNFSMNSNSSITIIRQMESIQPNETKSETVNDDEQMILTEVAGSIATIDVDCDVRLTSKMKAIESNTIDEKAVDKINNDDAEIIETEGVLMKENLNIPIESSNEPLTQLKTNTEIIETQNQDIEIPVENEIEILDERIGGFFQINDLAIPYIDLKNHAFKLTERFATFSKYVPIEMLIEESIILEDHKLTAVLEAEKWHIEFLNRLIKRVYKIENKFKDGLKLVNIYQVLLESQNANFLRKLMLGLPDAKIVRNYSIIINLRGGLILHKDKNVIPYVICGGKKIVPRGCVLNVLGHYNETANSILFRSSKNLMIRFKEFFELILLYAGLEVNMGKFIKLVDLTMLCEQYPDDFNHLCSFTDKFPVDWKYSIKKFMAKKEKNDVQTSNSVESINENMNEYSNRDENDRYGAGSQKDEDKNSENLTPIASQNSVTSKVLSLKNAEDYADSSILASTKISSLKDNVITKDNEADAIISLPSNGAIKNVNFNKVITNSSTVDKSFITPDNIDTRNLAYLKYNEIKNTKKSSEKLATGYNSTNIRTAKLIDIIKNKPIFSVNSRLTLTTVNKNSNSKVKSKIRDKIKLAVKNENSSKIAPLMKPIKKFNVISDYKEPVKKGVSSDGSSSTKADTKEEKKLEVGRCSEACKISTADANDKNEKENLNIVKNKKRPKKLNDCEKSVSVSDKSSKTVGKLKERKLETDNSGLNKQETRDVGMLCDTLEPEMCIDSIIKEIIKQSPKKTGKDKNMGSCSFKCKSDVVSNVIKKKRTKKKHVINDSIIQFSSTNAQSTFNKEFYLKKFKIRECSVVLKRLDCKNFSSN